MNDNKNKWFDKSRIDVDKTPRTSKEFSDLIENSDGVLKFVDVEIVPTEAAQNENENFDVPFTISTAAVDRDGDTIKQDGWELSEYMKNPVVLWAHDTTSPPVAKSTMVFVDPETSTLKSVAKFPSKDLYPFGNMIGRMYLNGFLRGASVGFMPIEYEIDEARDGLMPTNFKKQKLLEWSAVPVPSNPEGLAQARSVGIDTTPMVEWAEKILDGAGALVLPRSLYEATYKQVAPVHFAVTRKDEEVSFSILEKEEIETEIDDVPKELLEDFYAKEEPETVEEKAVIPFKAYTAAPEGDEWDSAVEERDATPEDLKIMSTWYDAENPDVKSSYKLPHHKAGSYDVVWRGVSAAMGALMGARGGVDIPEQDRKGVYEHLAKHYKQFGKEPPPFEKEVSENIEEKDDSLSPEGDTGDDTYQIPDLKSFQSMVVESARVEMDELRGLIGRLTGQEQGDKQ